MVNSVRKQCYCATRLLLKCKKGKLYAVFVSVLLSFLSCQIESPNSNGALEVVTYSQFDDFVKKTGYVTDAEKFGWSIVQRDVFNFSKVEGATWRNPDGKNKPKSRDLPVTQISYNDAIAYCKWSGSRLPTYDEYWHLSEADKRKVISGHNGPITTISEVNIVGNVWEITTTESTGNIRLAGGSLYCSPIVCNGTTKQRELYVDKQTANIHIGFAVIH